MFPVSVTQAFKTASAEKPFFSKGTGKFCHVYSSVENSITCIGMFQKVTLPVILRNSSLLLTGCDAIKNESLTNVLKGVLKILEKLQDVLYNGVSV